MPLASSALKKPSNFAKSISEAIGPIITGVFEVADESDSLSYDEFVPIYEMILGQMTDVSMSDEYDPSEMSNENNYGELTIEELREKKEEL